MAVSSKKAFRYAHSDFRHVGKAAKALIAGVAILAAGCKLPVGTIATDVQINRMLAQPDVKAVEYERTDDPKKFRLTEVRFKEGTVQTIRSRLERVRGTVEHIDRVAKGEPHTYVPLDTIPKAAEDIRQVELQLFRLKKDFPDAVGKYFDQVVSLKGDFEQAVSNYNIHLAFSDLERLEENVKEGLIIPAIHFSNADKKMEEAKAAKHHGRFLRKYKERKAAVLELSDTLKKTGTQKGTLTEFRPFAR